MERKLLTDEEVLSLEKILIKDNHEITAIAFSYGYGGIGNTNTSKYATTDEAFIPLSDLKGKEPRQFGPFYFPAGGWEAKFDVNVKLYAVVADVVYLVARGKVSSHPLGDCYCYSSRIAYDTDADFYLRGVCGKAKGDKRATFKK